MHNTHQTAQHRPKFNKRRTLIVNIAHLFALMNAAPRRILLSLSLICLCMLGFGLYLQLVVGLNPCPMCIVQRYALILVAICAALTSASGKKGIHITGSLLMASLAGGGAYVAARQSWLQWYPPEVVSCGRDFYGMIETFPLQRAIPMIFRGTGDCSKIDWSFLGGSLANWSFLCFSAFTLLGLLLAWSRWRATAQ